jgi:hypothetical protein
LKRLHQRGNEIVVFGFPQEARKTQFLAGDRIETYICPQPNINR